MEKNIMKDIRLEKITLNVGAGKDQAVLEKGVKLIKNISGISPVKTVTQKRIPEWGLRPGLPIGCKLTLRKKPAAELLKRLLVAMDNKLLQTHFDGSGNISFGVKEYIDVPEAKYDPEIGIMGFQVCTTLERKGFRIKRRRLKNSKLSKSHKISKQEAIAFMENAFKIKVEQEE